MPVPAAPRMACAAILTAICGAAGAWAQRHWMGCWYFAPDGTAIGRIALPERCANVCASAASNAIACLWRERSQSTRCTSTPGRGRRLTCTLCPLSPRSKPLLFVPACKMEPKPCKTRLKSHPLLFDRCIRILAQNCLTLTCHKAR